MTHTRTIHHTHGRRTKMTDKKHTPLPWKVDNYGDIVCDAKKDKDGLVGGKYYADIIANPSYGDFATLPSDDDVKLIVDSVNNVARYEERIKELEEELHQARRTIGLSCANKGYFADGADILYVEGIPTPKGLILTVVKNQVILQQVTEKQALKQDISK